MTEFISWISRFCGLFPLMNVIKPVNHHSFLLVAQKTKIVAFVIDCGVSDHNSHPGRRIIKVVHRFLYNSNIHSFVTWCWNLDFILNIIISAMMIFEFKYLNSNICYSILSIYQIFSLSIVMFLSATYWISIQTWAA